MRDKLFQYIKKKYKASPEYLWRRFPDDAVFRHSDNQKWFCLFMTVSGHKLGMPGWDGKQPSAIVEIINVKVSEPLLIDALVKRPGYFWGYHFSRGNWISIVLDGTVPFDEICQWIDESFLATAPKELKQKLRQPKEWIIPANPKYYDIEHAFDHEKEISWKQGTGIKKGDTVFIYVGAPVSAILFRCQVTDTDIPCDFDNGKLKISKLMKIKLKKRYKPDRYTFKVLSREYGIHAVRGPRGIPDRLSDALK